MLRGEKETQSKVNKYSNSKINNLTRLKQHFHPCSCGKIHNSTTLERNKNLRTGEHI